MTKLLESFFLYLFNFCYFRVPWLNKISRRLLHYDWFKFQSCQGYFSTKNCFPRCII